MPAPAADVSEGMIDWTTVKPYFETDAIAHLATLMMDGSPHSVPLWVGVEGERLARHTVRKQQRKDAHAN